MKHNLVKVIATLGPSSSNPTVIAGIVRAGANAFRINMSHGNVESWDSLIASVAKVEESLGIHLGLIADLEGNRVRLGDFEPLNVSPGSIVTFSLSKLGDNDVIVPHKEFFETIDEGDIVLVDDGKVSLIVESVEGFTAKLKVIDGKVIEPRKGVVVSSKEIEGPLVTSKDKACLEYIAKRPFSHVMVSYVRSPEHIEVIKAILRDYGRPDIKVLAKIETPAGVMKVRDIAQASDGIVVARGDLGMHFKLEDIPIIQRDIVAAARTQYKPVVLATEFLSSMIESLVPTRSEIVDIYEAVRLSADALLLTGETAIGRNPVKAVQWMAKVIAKAQQGYVPERPPTTIQIYRLVRGLIELIENLNATLVVYSRTGRFAERLAAFRPTRTIYVGVPNEKIERAIRTLWATEPVVVGDMPYEEGLKKTVAKLEEEGVISVGDVIVEAAWSSERGVYMVRVRNIIAP